MLNFEEFIKAVEKYELEDNISQASAHTSAVCVSDWARIQNALQQNNNSLKSEISSE